MSTDKRWYKAGKIIVELCKLGFNNTVTGNIHRNARDSDKICDKLQPGGVTIKNDIK